MQHLPIILVIMGIISFEVIQCIRNQTLVEWAYMAYGAENS